VRLWIDTDAGDYPDDTIALWCAAHDADVDLVGVSTVDGDVNRRANFVRTLLPGADVHPGIPDPANLASVDVLLGIGPWTNVARLAEAGELPLRVVLMGGVLGTVRHRGEMVNVEHNVGTDPAAAAFLLATTGNLIVVPLDATARLTVGEHDERLLIDASPPLAKQLLAWRERVGTEQPIVLHDPAALLVAIGERIARLESRRLEVQPDGVMRASVAGPLQHVVAHIHADTTRERIAMLASTQQG
jgi:inosine-uridine nucleoside N-ribohydrolase